MRRLGTLERMVLENKECIVQHILLLGKPFVSGSNHENQKIEKITDVFITFKRYTHPDVLSLISTTRRPDTVHNRPKSR